MQKQDFNQGWSYMRAGGSGAEAVTLPHDAMIHEPRTADSSGGAAAGWFSGGKYIYEKVFEVPDKWKAKHIELLFEGVYKNAAVYINRQKVAEHAYGYTPFSVVLDRRLLFGETNELRVEVDNQELPNSRWYSGAGIYRPVWLLVSDKKYIHQNGVRITTLSYEPARIRVETIHEAGDIEIEILDHGLLVGSGRGDTVEIDIPGAFLWSDETPYLYTAILF